MSKESDRPELIIIAGPNGSGKTTVTQRFLHHHWSDGILYINPDEIANEKYGDWNSSDAILKAADYCSKLREKCLRERTSFVFETVFSSQDKIDFLLRAKDAGYFIRFFFISTSHPSINASRITTRVMEGGHDVPITKIISRYYKSITNCEVIASIVDRLYVYDNSLDESDAKLLFRLSSGSVAKMYVERVPEWAQNILPGKETIS